MLPHATTQYPGEEFDEYKFDATELSSSQSAEVAKRLLREGAINGLSVGLQSATFLDALHSVDASCLRRLVLKQTSVEGLEAATTGYDKATGARVVLGVSAADIRSSCQSGESAVDAVLNRSVLTSFDGGGTFGGDKRSMYDPFRVAYYYGVDNVNAAGTATQLTGRGAVAGLTGLHDAIGAMREQESREWLSLRAAGELRASAIVALLSQRACDINNDAKSRFALELLLDDPSSLEEAMELDTEIDDKLSGLVLRCAKISDTDAFVQGVTAYLSDS